MSIPPGFTVITCEPVDEEALQAWATLNGAVWSPVESRWCGPARAVWNFGSFCDMQTNTRRLTEIARAEYAPLMHMPPLGVINVELLEELDGSARLISVLQSLFECWDSYVYDVCAHEWVSSLLGKLLPSARIPQRELSPPRPCGPWIWVGR